ncbi:PREDICTED: putative methyl-CpG-binding domain protein 3-like 3 [Miniopterus natalensis]|uniref:putative methyl-CpG-binding domain protein 3-like 3 n=1 Tax=Miniopterus natalensis TaxID=291302 RepID=UPI0007A6B78E|nr:PREDICTED: putative methyl-CpG-binding domain protein 3-like 3 [Miniopterus natalensis]
MAHLDYLLIGLSTPFLHKRGITGGSHCIFQQATGSLHLRSGSAGSSAAMGEPASVCIANQPFLGKLKRNMISPTSAKKTQLLSSKTKRQRRRERSALPMRLTNCIFKKPVTRVTSHPGNVVRSRRQGEPWERPRQVCAFRRLQGLQPCSREGELLSTLDVTNTMKIIAPESAGESLGCAGPGSLHTSLEPTTAQFLGWAEMIPGGLCVPQLLCRQPVTRGDIQRQTLKVKKARERLAVALRADRLAREAERARSQEGCCEN